MLALQEASLTRLEAQRMMHRSTHGSARSSGSTRRRTLGSLVRSLTLAAVLPAGLAARAAPAQELEPTQEPTRTSGETARPTKSSARGAARHRARDAIRERAERDRAYRVVVSLADRRLRVIQGRDVIMDAPVAVGNGMTLRGLGQSWKFDTPRGVRTVQRKRVNPVWIPPDWMYVETAKEHGLRVERLDEGKPRVLSDGSRLVIRNGIVRRVTRNRTYTPRLDEHIVFDEILFIPPSSTKNRRVEGELGRYALDTGDGYMIHGTRFESTVGQRASHGCIRMLDDDIAWLYKNVPVGTRVYLY
jgi:lipoprotein-anchoring transpeptidase ErfK/SrfK